MRHSISLIGPLALAFAAPVLADPEPPLAFETRLDLGSGTRTIERIVVMTQGGMRTFGPDDWLRPSVTGYAQAPAEIVVAFGTPGRPQLPDGQQSRTGADLPATPDGAARLGVLTDDIINSALLNIAQDIDGVVLDFDDGLVNGPGPELVIAEASLPPGGISPACPGVPAPGADPMVVALPNGASLEIPTDAFADFGPVGTMGAHGAAEPAGEEGRFASTAAMETTEMRPVAAVSYFKTYATALDLSDLGVADGDVVDTVILRSIGVEVETDEGPRLCWTSDPAFVAGLPAG